MSELILVLLLFAFMTPYHLTLGIIPNGAKFFIEYFWYVSVQFLFFISVAHTSSVRAMSGIVVGWEQGVLHIVIRGSVSFEQQQYGRVAFKFPY